MGKRIAAVAAILLAAACARPPVQDEVTIDFSNEDDSVVVTAETRFELQTGSSEAQARVDSARAAAVSGTDPWAVRFARITAETERHSVQKQRGQLERVTRSVRIRADELQQVFSDMNITVNVVNGEGWRELAFYPGTSGRATREQQAHFNAELTRWSALVARYYEAIHDLYSYMDRNPHRARYLFAALLDEKGSDGFVPAVGEEEQPLIDRVLEAMDAVAQRMDEQEGRAVTFAEEADLLFNPFPARMTVRVPGEVLSHDGFTKSGESLVIEPVDLFAAITTLEGTWIAPDPLTALLREESTPSEELARLERKHPTSVSALEIADAIRRQLARSGTYSVRWRS
ncbi:MAG TPA: hypothetical protein VHK90_18655 [Thermoanaerobaculia bacterium]|nr:hypothetical protein [Thermoanaerobaculia bacterium]